MTDTTTPGKARLQTTPYSAFILLIPMMLLIAIAIFFMSDRILVEQRGNRFDIYPRLVGASAIWRGESPYSREVTDQIQIGMFGRVLGVGEDEQRFAHPAYTGILLAPLVVVPERTAVTLWLTIQLLAIVSTPFIWLAILNWRIRPLLLLLVVALLFVFRYPIIAYVVGQFTGLMTFLISLGFLFLTQRRDAWAGVTFALATIPPTTTGPIVIIILVGYLLTGRYRGLLAFALTLAVLTLLSILQIGWWIPDFIAGLRAYTEYSYPIWALDYLPSLLRLPALVALGGLVIWAIYRFWRQPSKVRALDLMTASILGCLILIPQTGNYFQVLDIPVLMVAFWYMRASGRWRNLLILFAVAVIASPWAYYGVPDPYLEFLVTPVLVGTLYLLSRFAHIRAGVSS